MSLKLALENLGFGPCYHMENIFRDPSELRHWEPALDGEDVDWTDVFAEFRATVDWPGAHFWRELATTFPGAKVLLNVRPADRWYASFSQTVKRLIEHRTLVLEPSFLPVLEFAQRMIAERDFDDSMSDESTMISLFHARTSEVESAIPSERLLKFDVSEGWEPLCRFLDVPVPDGEFPRVNDQDEFWQVFGAGKKL
jgi:hypothetical protein